MKKSILISIILILLSILTISIQTHANQSPLQPSFDFRQTKWGMTKNEVIKTEKLEIIAEDQDDDSKLSYITTIANKDCFLFYSFQNDNKLESAGYILNIKHIILNDYINDYSDLKTLLTNKYNKPAIDKINWKNEMFKNEPKNYGVAISVGHLEYKTMWETPNTGIILYLYGENCKISLMIIYYDKNYANQ